MLTDPSSPEGCFSQVMTIDGTPKTFLFFNNEASGVGPNALQAMYCVKPDIFVSGSPDPRCTVSRMHARSHDDQHIPRILVITLPE